MEIESLLRELKEALDEMKKGKASEVQQSQMLWKGVWYLRLSEAVSFPNWLSFKLNTDLSREKNLNNVTAMNRLVPVEYVAGIIKV